MPLRDDIHIGNIDSARLKKMIVANHYSRRCSSIKVGYGVWYHGLLSGGIVFSSSTGLHPQAYAPPAHRSEVIELTRLWLDDAMPRNSESIVISTACRHLKRNRGRYRAIISYADEAAGHVGTIYQATNWLYLGSVKGVDKLRINGKLVASRSVGRKFGTWSVSRVGALLGTDDIERVPQARKHVYLYPLEREVSKAAQSRIMPYPKLNDPTPAAPAA